MSESHAGPRPEECQEPEDVGKLFHGKERDVWYECVFDRRKQVFTWTILPPEDVAPRKQRGEGSS